MNPVLLLSVLVVMVTTSPHPAPLPLPAAGPDDLLLRQLYAENAAPLRSYVRRFTTEAEADDVVQETFIRAWRHLDRLRADGRPLRPWLMRVARHLLADAARRNRRRPATVPVEVTAATMGVDGGLDRVLDQQVLSAALRRLSEGQLAVLVESWVLGASLDTAAQHLGIPAGTARSRLHYARHALRGHLAPTERAAS